MQSLELPKGPREFPSNQHTQWPRRHFDLRCLGLSLIAGKEGPVDRDRDLAAILRRQAAELFHCYAMLVQLAPPALCQHLKERSVSIVRAPRIPFLTDLFSFFNEKFSASALKAASKSFVSTVLGAVDLVDKKHLELQGQPLGNGEEAGPFSGLGLQFASSRASSSRAHHRGTQ